MFIPYLRQRAKTGKSDEFVVDSARGALHFELRVWTDSTTLAVIRRPIDLRDTPFLVD